MMIRVELAHTFPVSPGDAFAYITDTTNWKEFFPNFVRLDDAAHAKWDTPGDMVTVVIRFLGREVQVNMKLEEYQKDNRVTYVAVNKVCPTPGMSDTSRRFPRDSSFVRLSPSHRGVGWPVCSTASCSNEPSQGHYARQSGISNRFSSNNARAHDHQDRESARVGHSDVGLAPRGRGDSLITWGTSANAGAWFQLADTSLGR